MPRMELPTKDTIKSKSHDILCKYFAEEPMYFDSETNKKIDAWWVSIDWKNKQYSTYDEDKIIITKPCYQVKNVTAWSILSHTAEYVGKSIFTLILLVIGCAALYGVAYCNYQVIFNRNIGEYLEFIAVSVISWLCMLVFGGEIVYNILVDWNIDKCVIGKDDKDDN